MKHEVTYKEAFLAALTGLLANPNRTVINRDLMEYARGANMPTGDLRKRLDTSDICRDADAVALEAVAFTAAVDKAHTTAIDRAIERLKQLHPDATGEMEEMAALTRMRGLLS